MWNLAPAAVVQQTRQSVCCQRGRPKSHARRPQPPTGSRPSQGTEGRVIQKQIDISFCKAKEGEQKERKMNLFFAFQPNWVCSAMVRCCVVLSQGHLVERSWFGSFGSFCMGMTTNQNGV